jgi:hypothetical protein
MENTFYNGIYIGIVIQNNDPERRGRVKVFVPHIAATIYEKWNETFKTGNDKHFVFLDKEINPDLDAILPYLKEVLPWAEISLPLFGGSASGKYNAYTKKGTTSDSNYWIGDQMDEGFRPAQNYTRDNRLSDAFSESGTTQNKLVNPNANQYVPSDYSNLSRGLFTIPNVGSHVWITFMEGDCNYPVVLGSFHGADDWKRIYTLQKTTDSDNKNFVSPDYPDSFENLSSDEKQELDHNMKTFRSKHVFNSNKHILEMIDTDLMEKVKLTHYSGSFLEFNNNTTSRLATNNDQTLILGDQFETIRRNKASCVSNHYESLIGGDRSTKIGDFQKSRQLGLQILDIMNDTHQYKMLFETSRTSSNAPYTSPLQSQKGSPPKCPVCGGAGIKFDLPCETCGGSGASPSSQDGSFPQDPLKTKLPDIIKSNQKKITTLELEAKIGNGGDDTELLTGNKTTVVGAVFNNLPSFRVDKKGKIRDEGAHIGKSGTYLTMAECPLVEYVDVDNVPGGDWKVTVGNKYDLTVGSNGISIKTTGPVDISGAILNISSESLNLMGHHETLIGSNDRIEMRADMITLHPMRNKRMNVLIDGQLNVRNNLKVIGGTHLEGELSFLHATTPLEWYDTEVGYGPKAHTHKFKAPPWTLLEDGEKVRMAQQALNQPNPVTNMKYPGFWVPA